MFLVLLYFPGIYIQNICSVAIYYLCINKPYKQTLHYDFFFMIESISIFTNENVFNTLKI